MEYDNVIGSAAIDSSVFEVNKKLELVINNSTKYTATIKAKKLNLLDLYTCEEKDSLNLSKGDILNFFLCLNNQISIEFYSCYSLIDKIATNDNGLEIGITYPKRIEKLGIRKFYRFNLNMEIMYKYINIIDHYSSFDLVPSSYFNRMHKGTLVDISGNGLKFETEELCRKEQEIIIELTELDNLKLHGVVEWIEPDKINNNIKVAISYKNIKSGDQEKIINFIFNKTREARSRF